MNGVQLPRFWISYKCSLSLNDAGYLGNLRGRRSKCPIFRYITWSLENFCFWTQKWPQFKWLHCLSSNWVSEHLAYVPQFLFPIWTNLYLTYGSNCLLVLGLRLLQVGRSFNDYFKLPAFKENSPLLTLWIAAAVCRRHTPPPHAAASHAAARRRLPPPRNAVASVARR